MSRMPARVGVNLILPLALHAFLIWLACGATMVLGRETLGLEAALRSMACRVGIHDLCPATAR